MKPHPLDKYDDTDMTESEFDRAFENGEPVEQGPPKHAISGMGSFVITKVAKGSKAIKIHASSNSVIVQSASRVRVGTMIHGQGATLESLTCVTQD